LKIKNLTQKWFDETAKEQNGVAVDSESDDSNSEDEQVIIDKSKFDLTTNL